jgi:hypothetical protein
MKAIYAVQIVNRDTGVAHVARVEATSTESARLRVLHLISRHEIVGDAQLAEVLEDSAPARVKPPPIPGMVTCPRCGGTKWSGGRGLIVWLGVILLFPLGVLLLFVKPTWRCRSCLYPYRSYSAPVDIGPHRGGVGGAVLIVLLMLALLLVGLITARS